MIAAVKSVIQRIASEDAWRECLRILRSLLLSLTPAIFCALWLPPSACVLSVMITLVLCYQASASFQERLFRLPLSTAHALIAMPMQCVFAAWVAVLLLLHRPALLGTSVFSVLLLALTSIAPLFRSESSKRTVRRLPFAITYCAVAVVVMTMQVTCLWLAI